MSLSKSDADTIATIEWAAATIRSSRDSVELSGESKRANRQCYRHVQPFRGHNFGVCSRFDFLHTDSKTASQFCVNHKRAFAVNIFGFMCCSHRCDCFRWRKSSFRQRQSCPSKQILQMINQKIGSPKKSITENIFRCAIHCLYRSKKGLNSSN